MLATLNLAWQLVLLLGLLSRPPGAANFFKLAARRPLVGLEVASMVPFAVVFDGFLSVFHGFPWFLVDVHGFSIIFPWICGGFLGRDLVSAWFLDVLRREWTGVYSGGPLPHDGVALREPARELRSVPFDPIYQIFVENHWNTLKKKQKQ